MLESFILEMHFQYKKYKKKLSGCESAKYEECCTCQIFCLVQNWLINSAECIGDPFSICLFSLFFFFGIVLI